MSWSINKKGPKAEVLAALREQKITRYGEGTDLNPEQHDAARDLAVKMVETIPVAFDGAEVEGYGHGDTTGSFNMSIKVTAIKLPPGPCPPALAPEQAPA